MKNQQNELSPFTITIYTQFENFRLYCYRCWVFYSLAIFFVFSRISDHAYAILLLVVVPNPHNCRCKAIASAMTTNELSFSTKKHAAGCFNDQCRLSTLTYRALSLSLFSPKKLLINVIEWHSDNYDLNNRQQHDERAQLYNPFLLMPIMSSWRYRYLCQLRGH